MEYCVDLGVFHGPLDLLLYLVRKDELDIFDIPLSSLTEQYLAYLKILQTIDVNLAGDFLVMATTLMELKSRMMLPHAEIDSNSETDPRTALVRQLLEYKRFRDAAERLQEFGDEQRKRYARIPVDIPAKDGDLPFEPIRDVELWDLVSAFGRLIRQTISLAPRNIVYDETPIETYMKEIVTRLGYEGRMPFRSLLDIPAARGRVVGKFLAVLELVKSKTVLAEQESAFDEIWLSLIESPASIPLASTPLASAVADSNGGEGDQTLTDSR